MESISIVHVLVIAYMFPYIYLFTYYIYILYLWKHTFFPIRSRLQNTFYKMPAAPLFTSPGRQLVDWVISSLLIGGWVIHSSTQPLPIRLHYFLVPYE